QCRPARFTRLGLLFRKHRQGPSNRTDCIHPRLGDSTNCCGCFAFKTGSPAWSYLGSCRKCCHICATRLSRGDDPRTLPFIAHFKLTTTGSLAFLIRHREGVAVDGERALCSGDLPLCRQNGSLSLGRPAPPCHSGP